MSIATEIERIKKAKNSIKDSIKSKGVEVSEDTKIDNYSSLIDKIMIGSNLELDFSNYDNTATYSDGRNFTKYATKIPDLDLTGLTNLVGFFYGLKNLEKLSNIIFDTNLKNLNNCFSNCTKLKRIPSIDTSKVTDFSGCFYGCENLVTIPNLKFTSATNISRLFYGCKKLQYTPFINSSTITSLSSTFEECSSLTSIQNLDVPNCTDLSGTFYGCEKLIVLNEIDASNVTSVASVLTNCKRLSVFDGFKNLGKSYTYKMDNNYSYKLDLSTCTSLSHESLVSIINNLYDLNLTYSVASGEKLYRQELVLGNTNLAKLSEDEIAIATNKGWNVS